MNINNFNSKSLVFYILSALCFTLAYWQITRAQFKADMYKIHSNQSGAIPITLSTNDYDSLSQEKVETLKRNTVNMYGVWVPNSTIYIDNRQSNGIPGVHVISALTLEGSDYFIWVNRGWARKAPGEISNNEEFVKGSLYLPTKITTALVSGRIETDLMRRIELSNNEDIMKNGFLWQNLTWDRLNTFAEEATSLSSKIALPFILWRNNIPSDSGLEKAEIQLKADEKFKHLGYAVQWIFFGLLSIGLAILIRRKNINVKNSN